MAYPPFFSPSVVTQEEKTRNRLVLEAKEIDWNAVWGSQIRLRQDNGACPCACLWQKPEHAQRYLEAMQANNAEYFLHTLEAVHIEPHFNVLDIGAGPGTMTISMARRAARVTAVEPAVGMADLLENRCRAEGLTNVSCLRRRWEDVNPGIELRGPYHVVIAAFSLGVEDLMGAITKINRTCCGTVYLFWFAGASTWERLYHDLWPQLHGRPYHSGPKADVIYNLLYQMGIYPDTTVFPFRSRLRFATFEDAVTEFGYRLGVADPDASTPLHGFLQTQLQTEGGDFTLTHEATCVRFRWMADPPRGAAF